MVRSNKGFTLVELMVVIVIMGVLAVLAIPKLTDVITKAKISEIPIVLGSWDHAQLAYIAEKGECAASTNDLAFEDPSNDSKWFDYRDASGNSQSSATYESYVKDSKKVGNFNGGDKGPYTTTSSDGKVTHTAEGNWKKYVPSFEGTTGGTGGTGETGE
jgi:prepilin-type N-terminal cleavage/methylation domain-containing protein